MKKISIDERKALRHLMDLLKIEGLSGQERNVAKAVTRKLIDAGCKRSWIRHDRVHEEIPGNWQVGNLILTLPGTDRRDRRLFMGHMDTVPLCRGAVPVVKGRRIVSDAPTALGGDNRTSVGALITMVETLLTHKLPHPPLTVLLTVGEEVGLWGARLVDPADLGNPTMGFNVDSGHPRYIVTGAIGADRWEAHVHGRSSHAGVAPQEGISAAMIASQAIAEVGRRGYFGQIRKGRRQGTSNVGTVRGGEASNQVTDYVFVRGESRSHDPAFVKQITQTYREAFNKAAAAVTDDRGRAGKVDFRADRDYDAFQMPDDSPPVLVAAACARRMRLRPLTLTSNGGLDANYLNAKGIPTVTLGAGQHKPHTIDEFIDIREYLMGCRLLTEIATTA